MERSGAGFPKLKWREVEKRCGNLYAGLGVLHMYTHPSFPPKRKPNVEFQ